MRDKKITSLFNSALKNVKQCLNRLYSLDNIWNYLNLHKGKEISQAVYIIGKEKTPKIHFHASFSNFEVQPLV